MTYDDPNPSVRRYVYTLLTVVTVAAAAARVLSVERVYEPSLHRPEPAYDAAAIVLPLSAAAPAGALTATAAADERWQRINPNAPPRVWPRTRPAPTPMFSSNDRSRWATIRALVDEHTFAIGKREYDAAGRYRDTGIIFEDGWQSLDKVLDPDTKVFYSSKPPLLPVLLAGEYWLLERLFGWTLKDDPWPVVCTILLTINVLTLAVYLRLMSRLLERYGRCDWGRLFIFAAACFGTFLTTFATTLNNHTVAAVTALVAVYPLLMDDNLSIGSVLTSGLFAGLTACFELPAAALLVSLGAVLLLLVPRRTLLAFVPAALLPLAAQAGLNYAAIGDWKPAYEKLDSPWYRYEGSYWAKAGAQRQGIDFAGDKEDRPTYAFHLLLGHHGVFSLTPVWLLSVAGLALSLVQWNCEGRRWALLALVTAGVSAVVIVFFAVIVSTVNYGGWTSGARWFFWLTPLWLLAALPAADRLAGSPWGRGLGYLLLAVSVFSASFPAWNPWRHPWVYQLLESGGWVRY
jgi:hypothetical protein